MTIDSVRQASLLVQLVAPACGDCRQGSQTPHTKVVLSVEVQYHVVPTLYIVVN